MYLLIFLFSFFGDGGNNVPAIKTKTITKVIKKALDIENYSLEKIGGTDSLQKGVFQKIFNQDNQVGFSYYGRVNTCRIGGCSNVGYAETSINFDSEYFDYIAVYDLQGKILLVKIYNYNATYGYEVCSNFWLKQFKNYEAKSDLNLDEEIDGISGATTSVEAMTNEIIAKTEQLNEMLSQY